MSEEQQVETVEAVKGFGPDWKCRDFQFELGGTYKHEGEVKACSSGFHAIEGYPMEVFGYYPPADSKYADVTIKGKISRRNEDSKVAGAEIFVRLELKIPDIISRSVKFILDRIESTKTESNTGDQSAATNTGYQSAATNTGDQSAATNTGYQSAATNTGYQSAATNTGDQSAATNTGYQSAATNTGYQSAATNTGDQSAATNTGYRSAATNTGYQSAATNTGYRSAATVEGKHSVAVASGFYGKAKGAEGCALFLVYRDEDAEDDNYGRILHAKAVIVGQDGVKPGTFYMLNRDGELVEADPAP